MRALDEVKFDDMQDRLFCAGDLVDRGPESFECLQLLHEPWVHSVSGNHEVMLCDWCDHTALTEPPPDSAVRGGAQWLYHLTPQRRDELYQVLLPKVRALPKVLKVGHSRVGFKILHAQATFGTTFLNDELLENETVLECSDILWARSLVESLVDQPVQYFELGSVWASSTPWAPGLGLTYVGHNIVNNALLHRSHLFIDCGAYLTAQDPQETLRLFEHDKVVDELQNAGLVS